MRYQRRYRKSKKAVNYSGEFGNRGQNHSLLMTILRSNSGKNTRAEQGREGQNKTKSTPECLTVAKTGRYADNPLNKPLQPRPNQVANKQTNTTIQAT
ncbi:MAG: hypothetical protein CBE00_03525 [Planctomycetaceae bacterium TMED240]|nr:hypothetical protein [Rhodopirellula sp.]OUX07733.1 MAG: hypothetical protein CBE00_03525 [Planctomycetaceae bacterium TMED240]